ncbi:hypothetical protein C8J37_11064 [Rhizobium sp. PP-WC-1G-195]|nr:hypothetical protein C8J37_11064 [Rhizobium sp. PP-WC-1G-195]
MPSRRASSTAWPTRRSPIFRPPPSRICGGSPWFAQSRGVPHISISPGINEMGPEVAAYIHGPNTASVVLGTDGLSGQRRSRLLVLFIAGNIITAVGPSYPIALVGRVITSHTWALFWHRFDHGGRSVRPQSSHECHSLHVHGTDPCHADRSTGRDLAGTDRIVACDIFRDNGDRYYRHRRGAAAGASRRAPRTAALAQRAGGFHRYSCLLAMGSRSSVPRHFSPPSPI